MWTLMGWCWNVSAPVLSTQTEYGYFSLGIDPQKPVAQVEYLQTQNVISIWI